MYVCYYKKKTIHSFNYLIQHSQILLTQTQLSRKNLQNIFNHFGHPENDCHLSVKLFGLYYFLNNFAETNLKTSRK